MKTTKYISALAMIVLLFNACSADWLNRLPEGSTITEEQFRQKEDKLHGCVFGAYSMMYEYSDHDQFGFRSIDMYGDLNCGDMAMKTSYYGWFEYDEQGWSYVRRLYYWNYYYGIIRQCNKGIVYAKDTKDANGNNLDISFLESCQYTEDPEVTDAIIVDSITAHQKYIKDNAALLNYYGQLIALRGWCYSNLQKYFVTTRDEGNWLAKGSTILSVPIYTEKDVLADTTLGNPRAKADSVHRFVVKDLNIAARLLQATEKGGFTRSIKQEVNSDVAFLLLAYHYLNAFYGESATEEVIAAAKFAKEFTDQTSAPILANNKVLTTGFAEVNESNWLWGEDVSIQTTTALGSFFGQVDIYTYSYAWAGDIKGIDNALYDEIKTNHPWDIRVKWWNNMSNYQYAPDSKFFSPTAKAQCTKSIPADKTDRTWLCDQVFMRAELGYLIAAEANWRCGEDKDAIKYLTAITQERVMEGKEDDYASWEAKLLNHASLGEEIRYNWRVELWGEGYGMQTFRRFKTSTLGSNHLTRKGKTIHYTDPYLFTYEIPQSELEYNPAIRSMTTLTKK